MRSLIRTGVSHFAVKYALAIALGKLFIHNSGRCFFRVIPVLG